MTTGEVDLTTVKPKITWWVWAGSERIRKTSKMRGTWGHDATCSCGWDSKTGGATRGSVERDVYFHKHVDHGVPYRTINL